MFHLKDSLADGRIKSNPFDHIFLILLQKLKNVIHCLISAFFFPSRS